MPTVGDMYDHATGVYKVDWVCGCGDYDDGETCIGLLGDTMTWTGNVSDLSSAGFTKHARDARELIGKISDASKENV